ncbi:uncharacterized protein LOC106669113 [Cimex lectularius]|uniref:Uncharacterized protein n=1 Tax=Cimex lectularius TaxID=79782 RepID=A0A8I6RX01_CIMLE|nr:uncharacterized protein LOC106669113 [Cimex lectularius]
MISPKFLICIAIIVLAAECNAAREQWNKAKAKTLLQKFKDWMNNKLQQFKQKVLNGVQKMKNFKDSLMKKSLTYIHEPVVSVEKDLATWKPMFPEKCMTTAQTQLKEVKTASAKEFFKCANLTNAFVDAAKIFSDSVGVVSKITQVCTDIVKAVFTCQPIVSPHGFMCAVRYVIKVIQELKEDVPVVKQYFVDMIRVGKDMKAQVQTCLHPPKAKLQTDVNNLITSLHTCVA